MSSTSSLEAFEADLQSMVGGDYPEEEHEISYDDDNDDASYDSDD